MTVPGIVIDAIKGARSVLVTSHIVPDGDAIGSVLGLGLTLMEMGKKVFMAVDGGVPKNMTFLPGSSYILPD
ncbi:MAG TPA: bifunctional oligoribonuclease/PAP phosphatase NrnA, partial [Bacillota bacterium]|nr:bifunctional oligoribonuclease/PAP phosphatase NrnA [Bacillota bacterium]